MLIDPAGVRWLSETWLKVDRGVDFYNHQPIRFDAPFLLSRLAFAAIGIGSVAWDARAFRGRACAAGVTARAVRAEDGRAGGRGAPRGSAALSSARDADRSRRDSSAARWTCSASNCAS